MRDDDIARLDEQGWAAKLGEPVTVQFRGVTYLRQRDDGGCLFLQDDGLCRIHAEYGFENKPIACQLFPFSLSPTAKGPAMGLSFACQSVRENKGAELASHRTELRRMAAHLPEVNTQPGPPRLSDSLRASAEEVKSITRHLDQWMRRDDLPFLIRLDGLAWITTSLTQATFAQVREKRLDGLLDLLFQALPDEIALAPNEPATTAQHRMLRQAVFTRTEDPKLGRIEQQGRLRTILDQLGRDRRLRKGRGLAPQIGHDWPADVELATVADVGPTVSDADREAIGDLLTRYVRATVLGGRAWGPAYYGWAMIPGLAAMTLNIAAVAWLARLHAAGHARETLTIDDVRAALGRIDRTSGRAPWLGSRAERLRLNYLCTDYGLRRLLHDLPMV